MFAMSYHGAKKVVPNYNLMGPVKAALEASCRYLAYELGPRGIRVHPISPGPLKTRAASGLKDFDLLLNEAAQPRPGRRAGRHRWTSASPAPILATPYARRMTGQTALRRRRRPHHGLTVRKPLLTVLSLLAAASCSVGPTFKAPEATVAQTWRAAGDPRVSAVAAADASWWRGFNDPTLDQLVDVSYRQNLQLQVAGLRILEARAQVAVATGMQFPQFQVLFGSATAIGLSRNVPSSPPSPAATASISWGSTPPGSSTSGESIGAGWSRRPPSCCRRWPTTTPPSSR